MRSSLTVEIPTSKKKYHFAGIIGCIMIRPYKVSNDIKMTSDAYAAHLRDHLEPLNGNLRENYQSYAE